MCPTRPLSAFVTRNVPQLFIHCINLIVPVWPLEAPLWVSCFSCFCFWVPSFAISGSKTRVNSHRYPQLGTTWGNEINIPHVSKARYKYRAVEYQNTIQRVTGKWWWSEWPVNEIAFRLLHCDLRIWEWWVLSIEIFIYFTGYLREWCGFSLVVSVNSSMLVPEMNRP